MTCDVPVKYAVKNNADGTQDWTREEICDDASVPFEATCNSCYTVYTHVELDNNGYLIGVS